MIDCKCSIVIPAKNEASSIKALVEDLFELVKPLEVIVVDDGSTDNTGELAAAAGAKVCRHVYSKGNGAAIKTGARAATSEVLIFMDGDGQHSARDVLHLLGKYNEGYDLVVGAREKVSQANYWRGFANGVYNRLASYMTGYHVADLTSGFRVANAAKFREFLYLLPNGFSYPTTSTMAFFRAGYSVKFETIEVKKREGKSHIKLFRDGIRFFLVIFKIGTLYSPLKIFFPVSCGFFAAGLSYYLFTFITASRFTNMSMLLMSSAVIIFLIGLISEQITNLMYKGE
ncbi:glycosyltransferase family 2 protein [Allohahella sp. A8]|uniref:glycosyltransferase family 2 protein n=1 Tax=Allohahella sp. A8 TaxID=3141461 RepID=UPI003A80B0DE